MTPWPLARCLMASPRAASPGGSGTARFVPFGPELDFDIVDEPAGGLSFWTFELWATAWGILTWL